MSEDFKVQASIKDYDGDMVNFRANSTEELKAEFAGFPYEEYASAKSQLRALSAIQPMLPSAPQQQAQAPAPAPQQAAPQAPPPQGQVHTCAHGVRVYKNGQGAKGPWQAWMCALPRGSAGACEPEWIR